MSWLALPLWLWACSLDSDLPVRNGGAAPANSGVTLSGAGGSNEFDASVGYGDGSRITDIDNSRRAPADSVPRGIDSADTFAESAGDIGGAAFRAGDDAGAGGVSGSSSGAAGESAREPPLIWFSEYIEGSSSNKALEITTQARALLDGCKVSTYFNGKTEATVVATLSGVLEAGQVLTLCTSALKEKLAIVCNQASNLTFNGDDAVALSCDGAILDVIGQIGVDPGDAWGSAADATSDHTLRRKCSVPSGDPLGTDEFNPSTEWQALPVDTFDGLGARGC